MSIPSYLATNDVTVVYAITSTISASAALVSKAVSDIAYNLDDGGLLLKIANSSILASGATPKGHVAIKPDHCATGSSKFVEHHH